MNPFQFCPQCKSDNVSFTQKKLFRCHRCDLHYFQNVASAVAAIIRKDNQILFLKRNREPSKGKLDFPGGFVEPGEALEEALKREIREELNVESKIGRYLFSLATQYLYKNINYHVCDVFFAVKPKNYDFEIDKEEGSEAIYLDPQSVKEDELAFISTKKALPKIKKIINEN